MIHKHCKIYIAGHNGMVGSSCYRALTRNGFNNLIVKSSIDLDLTNQSLVLDFIADEKPDVIINAAAKVGGILANDTYPYEFLMQNLLIQNNLIQASHMFNISKFVFLGSSCVYPKFAEQPIKEEYLMTGPLEPTNEWYAIAKITGIKLIESLRKQYNRDYIALMPTNLYGPGDNFDLKTSHVLPALLKKFHDAKLNNRPHVNIWGSGKPLREFLHVDDLAKAVIHILNKNNLPYHLYNVGTGLDISINDLAKLIKEIIGFKGEIKFDKSKPDGTPRKLLDITRISTLGWNPEKELNQGIREVYDWFIENKVN